MTLRIIAGLEVKPPFLVKGIHLEGLRKIGTPEEKAIKYYLDGIDEIVYQDVVATLFGRSGIFDLVRKTAKEIFIPITAGGGISNVDEAGQILQSGADKISLNTAAIKNPAILKDISNKFGQQSIVLRIEAKQKQGDWFCMTNSGRENTDLRVLNWVDSAQKMGVGEILLTSIDKDGTLAGPDFDLINHIRSTTRISLLVNGGIASPEDVVECAKLGVDGVVISSALHFNKINISELKLKLIENNIEVRI